MFFETQCIKQDSELVT